ncbi:MAG TPA: aminotransferase class I/II-fold pyridoxal phosphate-dependent enzyme [Planctomycetaceae bacterium]|nr:aminotransferase class I/II-fold pyridoxal phosphate-dependent enzyme [Planctomycetaceae bacterium]
MNVPSNHRPDESTIAARGGWAADFETRPSAPPMYLTTAFDLDDLQQLDAVVGGQQTGFIYTRDGNPNHEAFAADVAVLEGAEAGVVSASGMGALAATFLALLKSGDHVVAGRALYGRSGQMLNHLAASFGIVVTFVNTNDVDTVRQAVTPQTKLCLIESLTNPLVDVTDVPAIAEAIGAIPLLVDNTFATPCLMKPIAHGATLVWHSASKYLNGHGDVMLGVLVGPRTLIRKIKGIAALYGVNSNPFESWLGSRGLRTLPLRMARVSQTAQRIAEFLTRQPQVVKAYYPGLATHSCRALAARLLDRGCGGMLSFELPGGRSAVDAFFRRLSGTIPFSPTLADARTTLSYPAGTSHKFLSAEERVACGITDGLVRLSIGLEDAADLERELATALNGG